MRKVSWLAGGELADGELAERSVAISVDDEVAATRSCRMDEDMRDEAVEYTWRGAFTNGEIHALHAEAFETRLFDESEWDWVAQTARYSLGWVVARSGDRFVGFANVLWDGLVHAFIEDVMVDADHRRDGVGIGLVHAARDGARTAGCEHLHVEFGAALTPFYIGACGFTPTSAGIMDLTD